MVSRTDSEAEDRDMHYHNLNSSTEGIRMMNFMIADLSGVLGDPHTLPERLEALLANPPKGMWPKLAQCKYCAEC